MKSDSSLLLFDGICNLCNFSIKQVLKHERDHVIQFVPLQSEFAQQVLTKANAILKESESIVFIEHQRVFIKSDAVIQIGYHLKSPWSWISCIRILPRPVRDFFYNLVARYRYVIFGKKETCMIPTENYKQRFIM